MTHPEASIAEHLPTILVVFPAPQYVGGGVGRLVINLGCTGIERIWTPMQGILGRCETETRQFRAMFLSER
jgi:hypothetical protein